VVDILSAAADTEGGLTGRQLLEAVREHLVSDAFVEATKALGGGAGARPALVLIDSVDEYSLDDAVAHALVQALINHLLNRSLDSSKMFAVAKAAFPSEINSRLTYINKTKVQEKSLTVSWTFGDLCCMVEKRLRLYLTDNGYIPKGATEDLKLTEPGVEGQVAALRSIYRFLPKSVEIQSGVTMSTMSYIVRHTQRQPRQLLFIFNAILTIAGSLETLKNGERVSEDSVKAGVRVATAQLAPGAMEVFEKLYPNAAQLIAAALSGCDSVMTESELAQCINRTARMRPVLSAEDVKRLLVEASVVGAAVGPEGRVGDNGLVARAVFADFSYNASRSVSAETWVVHPMFYEGLSIRQTPGVVALVRPDHSESELQEGVFGLVCRSQGRSS